MSLIKQIIKAIIIWVLLIMLYFVLNLWLNVNVPIISDIFGINLIINNNAGYSITMSSIFPNWIINMLCFVGIYVGVSYFWKINKK